MNAKAMKQSIQRFGSKHGSEILIIFGCIGIAGTVASAVKATTKANQLLEAKKKEKKKKNEEFHPVIDTIKTTWMCYIPTITLAVLSAGCFIGANQRQMKANAALATAYAISEKTLKEFKDNTLKVVGEKKTEEIRQSIDQSRMEKTPVNKTEVIVTGKGDTLCFDSLTGRYFQSSRNALIRAENDLNRQMRVYNFISLNEFFMEIGLDPVKDVIGEEFGWDIDYGYIELEFRSHLAEDGTPCLLVDYKVEPRCNYRR